CDIRGRRTLKPLHLTTYLLVRAYQQLWLDEHHGPSGSTSVGFNLRPCVPSSRPPCAAGSRRVGSRVHGRPCGRGYVVPRASDIVARRGRKLLTEQKVTAVSILSGWCYSS